MGLPKALNFIKDVITEDIPKAVGFLGERAQEPAMGVGALVPGGRYKPEKLFRWFLGGGRSPYQPSEEPLLEQIRGVRSEQEAKAVLDQVIGHEESDDNLLAVMRDRGMLSRIMTGKDDRAGNPLSLDPYNSDYANGLMRIGGLSDMRGIDPYYLQDTLLQEAFSSNDRLAMLYLRETDPMAALKAMETGILETQTTHSDGVKDKFGRILGGAKAIVWGWTGFPYRIEEIFGNMYFNDIANPYLKFQMARNAYGYAVNPWDLTGTREKQVRSEINTIMASGATGPDAVTALDNWFQANPSNASFFVTNLVGQIALDPAWLIPADKLIKGGAAAITAATGAPTAGRVFRYLSPAARAMKKEDNLGWKAVFQMPVFSYAAKTFRSPAKGVTRLLMTPTPHSAGAEAGRKLLTYTAGVTQELFDNPENLKDLLQSLKKGKAIGFVERRMPGLMDDPAVAAIYAVGKDTDKLGGMVAKELNKPLAQGLAEGSYIAKFDERIAQVGKDTAEGLSVAAQKYAFLQHTLTHAADQMVTNGYNDLFRSTKFGKFLLTRWSPVVNTMRPAIMFVTINNPAFIGLNLISNHIRFLWSTARHPLLANEMFAKSMLYEFAKRGKTTEEYPKIWTRMLQAIGWDPLDVELTQVRQSAMGRLVGQHTDIEDISKLTGAETNALMEKYVSKPIADYNKFSVGGLFKNLFWGPINAAAMLDRGTRRGTFYAALHEQLHWGTAESWLKKAGIPPIASALEKAGMPREIAQLAEDMVRDRTKAIATGMSELPAGQKLDLEKTRGIYEEVAGHFAGGDEGKLFSVSKVARDWAAGKGFVGEAAIPVTQDIAPFSDQIFTEVLWENLPKVVRKEMTLRQLEDMIDARVLDYFTVHDNLSAMGRVSSIWRPNSNWQDALRLNDRALRDDMVDNMAHLERHNKQVIYPYSEQKVTIREFHALSAKNTVDNTNELAAINEYIRAGTREGETLASRAEKIAQMHEEHFANKLSRHMEIYEWEVAETAKRSEAHVKLVDEWHKRWMDTYEFHRQMITDALKKGTDEAMLENASKVAKRYAEDAAARGEIFGHGPNDFPAAAQTMDATGPLAAQVDDFATFLKASIRKAMPNLRGPQWFHGTGKQFGVFHEGAFDLEALFGPGVYLTDDAAIASGYAKAAAKKVTRRGVGAAGEPIVHPVGIPPNTKFLDLEKSLPENVVQLLEKRAAELPDSAWVDAAKAGRSGKLGREVYYAYRQGLSDLGVTRIEAGEALDALNASMQEVGYDGLRHLGGIGGGKKHNVRILFNPEKATILSGARAASPLEFGEGSVVASVLRRMADEGYSHWRGAVQQMVSNAMAKTDFVMLNYNAQVGADRVFQMFMPYVFWPTRDAAHWGIRAARSPGAFAGLLAAMNAPRQYAKEYGYPERLAYEIPIPLPFLDDFLHDMPLVKDLLADVNFGPVYWVDPLRFVFPFTDYRQIYDNDKRRGTPAGLIADYVEQYTPLNFNPFAKIVGAETGLLDKDAWASVQFNGGPFGIPLTPAAQLAARWLYGGDLNAIPESEMYTWVDKGHPSVPFIGEVLGLTPDAYDIYRAERSAWCLALTDQLLPGKPHEEQVRAAMEAVDTHKGVAWAKALRSSEDEYFLRQLTGYIGFPLGAVTPMNEGEYMSIAIRQAYSAYADEGRLDEFFKKYPEFSVRSAVVKGLNNPKEKDIAIDTELYYTDVERLAKVPYEPAIDQIDQQLSDLANMDQTPPVREQRQILLDKLSEIRDQQSKVYDMLDKAYPNRKQELSFNWPPRERALKMVRNAWEDIVQQPGESYEEFRQRQETFLSQFPPDEQAWGVGDWDTSYQRQLATMVEYNQKMGRAVSNEDWDAMDEHQQWRDSKVAAIHDEAMNAKLSRRAVESYLASWSAPKSPEQVEFAEAKDMFDLWMGLVGKGSMFTSREKAAISDYFRTQPLIQKHYPLEVIPLESLGYEDRLRLMRRDEIWSTYYGMQGAETRMDYIRSVAPELNAINTRFGFPPLQLIDYEVPPPELGLGDPLRARLEMYLTTARERALKNQTDQELDPATLKLYDQMLSMDPNDPSSLSSQGLEWYLRQFSNPDQTQ